MSWINHTVPPEFRDVHREWSGLTFSERDNFRRRLAQARDFAMLALFRRWESWYRSVTSPWRGTRGGAT
ncbi:MAG: hypothetical protein AB8F26_05500 [Phycisphaerales bacterium]